jgi:hypothetical protein
MGLRKHHFCSAQVGQNSAAAMKKYLSRKSPLLHLHTVGKAEEKSRNRQKKLDRNGKKQIM